MNTKDTEKKVQTKVSDELSEDDLEEVAGGSAVGILTGLFNPSMTIQFNVYGSARRLN